MSQAKGQMAELQAQVCPSLSQAKGQMAELQAQTLLADQGEGLSISSWIGEPDRVALTSEADS